MTMRTARRLSGIGAFRHGDLDPRADTRGRLDRELGANQPGPFLDDSRPRAALVELRQREPPFEGKAASVVLDDELAASGVRRQADEHLSGAAVLPHVDERLAGDADELDGLLARDGDAGARADEPRADPGF